MWKILGVVNKDHREYLEVECNFCGHIKHARATTIHKDRKCKRCMLIKRNKTPSNRERKMGSFTSLYKYFKALAGRRGIEFTVTEEYLKQILDKQNHKCALSGLDIQVGCANAKSIKENSASLDRIDSSNGYHEGNVQWLHKHVNVLKNGFSQEEFIHLCHKVAKCHVDPEPSSLNGNKRVREKVQRLTGEES